MRESSISVEPKKNSLSKGTTVGKYPIQVTEFMPDINELKTWEDFLNKKGYETQVIHKDFKTGIRKYALFRNITTKELEEIQAKLFKISYGSFIKRVDTNHPFETPVNCECPRCGSKFTGYKCRKQKFCTDCASFLRNGGNAV